MNDRKSLLAAIIREPQEDTPRLAYADHIEEHGGTAEALYAEFIRAQIKRHVLQKEARAAVQLRDYEMGNTGQLRWLRGTITRPLPRNRHGELFHVYRVTCGPPHDRRQFRSCVLTEYREDPYSKEARVVFSLDFDHGECPVRQQTDALDIRIAELFGQLGCWPPEAKVWCQYTPEPLNVCGDDRPEYELFVSRGFPSQMSCSWPQFVVRHRDLVWPKGADWEVPPTAYPIETVRLLARPHIKKYPYPDKEFERWGVVLPGQEVLESECELMTAMTAAEHRSGLVDQKAIRQLQLRCCEKKWKGVHFVIPGARSYSAEETPLENSFVAPTGAPG